MRMGAGVAAQAGLIATMSGGGSFASGKEFRKGARGIRDAGLWQILMGGAAESG